MERPEDFEEREDPPAQVDADPAAAIRGDESPSHEDRDAGTGMPQAVTGAEDQPDI